MYRFKRWQNNINHAFPSNRCISNEKLFIHFTMKIIRTYLYITCNKKIWFVKKYLSLLWVFTDFSVLLVAFWTQCDTTATNSNSENARSRMVASLRGSVGTGIDHLVQGTGTREDESSSGRVWAARFHHVTARPRLARVLKLMNSLFSKCFFRAADTGVRLYI